jgi:hypothetical protein
VLKDLKQPSQGRLFAGQDGGDPAVSLRPWKGKLKGGQFTGVHNAKLLLAALASAARYGDWSA